MNAKSKFAFQFSVESMRADVYFWTFTFKEALAVVDARKRWHRFLSDRNGLVKCFPTMSGLRVFEMHPGGPMGLSHGLHVHMVVNEFLPVDIVRILWHKVGGGRLHVKLVPKKAGLYLGKYLSKERPECLKGVRLWAPVGQFEAHNVRDIVVNSPWTAAYRVLSASVKNFAALPWVQRLHLVAQFMSGKSIAESMRPVESLEHWMSSREEERPIDPREDTDNDEFWEDV